MQNKSVFIINKKNILKNLKNLNSNYICAMVKADAYGLGLKTICQILKGRVNYFGVASLDEALKIREFDKATSILVVGICEDFITANQNNVDITIDNLLQLTNIAEKIKEKNLEDKLNIHIKINTGMNRLGINSIAEFKKALQLLNKYKCFTFKGIYTHFATATSDVFYFKNQLKKFQEFLNEIPSIYNPIKHLGGGDVLDILTNANKFNIDINKNGFMFRVGLKLYDNVLKINSEIIKILILPKRSRVGYSNGFICEKNSKIAVVPLGYADGINRKLSNKGTVKINNKVCKIVGNVCMDMFYCDVTDIDCDIKDKVTVFKDANEWAKICDTIPYEILTNFKYSRMQYVVE